MDKHFKPDSIFSTDPNSKNADKEFKHWKMVFERYLSKIVVADGQELDKLGLLFNNVSADIFSYISSQDSYSEAIKVLEDMYIRPQNTIFARFCLKDRKQGASESMDEYMRQLQILVKDCNYQAVTAQLYEEESIRDAFIAGIGSNDIRQRLLEQTDNLANIFDKARSLEQAYKNNEQFSNSLDHMNTASINAMTIEQQDDHNVVAAMSVKGKTLRGSSESEQLCFFCGYERHNRTRCPARDKICKSCNKQGHFASVCRAGRRHGTVNTPPKITTTSKSHISALSDTFRMQAPNDLADSVVNVKVNKSSFHALIDTGSTESFINSSVANDMLLQVHKTDKTIHMASNNHTTQTLGYCIVDLYFDGHHHNAIKLFVLRDLITDVILGHDILRTHKSLIVNFKGNRRSIEIGKVSQVCSVSHSTSSSLNKAVGGHPDIT